MKRLLIISYYWPPTGGSGVQRWVKFAKYLPSQGWQPVVYTPENPEQLAVDSTLLADIPDCAEIIKTPIREPYKAYRRFLKIFSRSGGSPSTALNMDERSNGTAALEGLNRGVTAFCGHSSIAPANRNQQSETTSLSKEEINPINNQKKGVMKKLAVMLRGNLFVPDPRVGWVKPSVKFLKEYLKEHPVDAMVTTGPPQSMHLIGLGLKKALGGECPEWIADFRDPWTQMFYFKHLGLLPIAKWRHHLLEHKVLDGADRIIAVTPRVQADFQALTKTPVDLITNGFDEDDFAVGSAAGTGKFTLVHTGLFAADGNPENLWDVLSAKCLKEEEFASKLEIRLAGKVDAEIIRSLQDKCLPYVNLGYLPHRESVAELKSASIALLPLRQEPEYAKVLPGKIFECLACRRPVLGIGQSDGAAADVLRQTGAGEMFDWDNICDVRAFVDTQWEMFLRGESQPLDSDISRYERKSLTAQLVKIL